MTTEKRLKIGLIGDNIGQSKAPLLHQLAGQQYGLSVHYDRLVPKELEVDFETLFDQCPARGYRGVNITYPYKERAAKKVHIEDPLVRAISAVNTVLFEADGPKGHNTDYTGFIAAYQAVRARQAPGIACLIGTGGVGRALAFGLVALQAEEIRLVDKDAVKAEALADDLRSVVNATKVVVHSDPIRAASGASGILNGTPIGMVGYEGTPLNRTAMKGASWAFDAVYTPVDTEFLQDALDQGLSILSGYELFFHQGVHAWTHFSGLPLDENRLRAALLEDTERLS